MKNVRVVLPVAVLVVALITAALGLSSAWSATRPEWTGVAGLANHACYDRKGVRQIFADDADLSGRGDLTAICGDGWALALTAHQ